MKSPLLASTISLAISAAAFAGDVSITFNPSSALFPPGSDPTTCEINGIAPECVVFSGTVTDTDTDGSYLFLNAIAVDFSADLAASAYFTVDNTFYNDVPGVYSGDPDWLANGNPSNTYTGPILGLDIAPSAPLGVYNLTADISGAGGTNDPNDNGFTEDVQFTVGVVSPEPAAGLMIIAGLLVIAVSRRPRRPHPC